MAIGISHHDRVIRRFPVTNRYSRWMTTTLWPEARARRQREDRKLGTYRTQARSITKKTIPYSVSQDPMREESTKEEDTIARSLSCYGAPGVTITVNDRSPAKAMLTLMAINYQPYLRFLKAFMDCRVH